MPAAERQWGKGQRSWMRDREGEQIERDTLIAAWQGAGEAGFGLLSGLVAREAVASCALDGETRSACVTCNGKGYVGADGMPGSSGANNYKCSACKGTGVV